MYEFPLSKRIENQIKSYFTNLEKIDLTIDENIRIIVIDENNVDPPSIEIKQVKENYELHFWDGYSQSEVCLLYTSPSPRDRLLSRMPSSA